MSKALLIAHISLTGVFDPAGKIFCLFFYFTGSGLKMVSYGCNRYLVLQPQD